MRILIDYLNSDGSHFPARFTVAEVDESKVKFIFKFPLYNCVDIPEWHQHDAITHFGSTVEISLSTSDIETFSNNCQRNLQELTPTNNKEDYAVSWLHMSLCAIFGCTAVYIHRG